MYSSEHIDARCARNHIVTGPRYAQRRSGRRPASQHIEGAFALLRCALCSGTRTRGKPSRHSGGSDKTSADRHGPLARSAREFAGESPRRRKLAGRRRIGTLRPLRSRAWVGEVIREQSGEMRSGGVLYPRLESQASAKDRRFSRIQSRAASACPKQLRAFEAGCATKARSPNELQQCAPIRGVGQGRQLRATALGR